MKKHLGSIHLWAIAFLASSTLVLAQPKDVKIPISVISRDTSSFGKLIVTRLQQAVSKTGMSEYDSYNFIMFPRVNELSHEVTSTAPSLTVVNLELTVIVANGDESKSIIFNTENFSIKGVGQSYEKARLDAARSLRPDNPKLQALVVSSRDAIIQYFAANCESIISEAEMMSKEAMLAVNTRGGNNGKAVTAENQFVSAISLLYNIRSANYTCYQKSIKQINQVLEKYDDFSCRLYLGLAKNYWAARQVDKTIEYLNKIPPSNKCRTEVDQLLREMDGYQERLSDKDYKHQIELMRTREKASKDMLDLVIDTQRNESTRSRESRRQDTIINLMSVNANPK